MIATMLGTWAGVCVGATNGCGFVEAMKRPWMQVLVRVVGSSMSACALLFLALSIAPKPLDNTPSTGAPQLLDVRK